MCNALWRFLHLRGYIDESHQLTAWGEMLLAVLDKLDSTKEQAEAAMMAVELMRLGVLNSEEMFHGYGGAPVRGSGKQQWKSMSMHVVTLYAR